MRFKQFLPLFSNFDLDIRILRVKIYKKHLFLSGDILLHTGRYPAPRLICSTDVCSTDVCSNGHLLEWTFARMDIFSNGHLLRTYLTGRMKNIVSRCANEERRISSRGRRRLYLAVYWPRTGRKSAEIRRSSSGRSGALFSNFIGHDKLANRPCF